MARRIFIFDPPDRFIAGAVGQPGQRIFYLQARKGGLVVSVALEKAQVAVLADRLGALVEELERRGIDISANAGAPSPVDEGAGLDEPLVEAFRVGTMTLGWNGEDRQIVVEARALAPDAGEEGAEARVEVPDEDPSGPDLVRVRIPGAAARAFAERAARIVAAGRPPCPLCGQPLNPEGHLCPRRNGYLH